MNVKTVEEVNESMKSDFNQFANVQSKFYDQG